MISRVGLSELKVKIAIAASQLCGSLAVWIDRHYVGPETAFAVWLWYDEIYETGHNSRYACCYRECCGTRIPSWP